jgi:hypothetical protein
MDYLRQRNEREADCRDPGRDGPAAHATEPGACRYPSASRRASGRFNPR